MTVTGFPNPSHVIRLFIANEYAFDIRYPKHSVRVAHWKGSWRLAKVRGGEVVDGVTVHDFGTGVESDSELTKALFEKIMEDALEKARKNRPEGRGPDREDDALGIEAALLIWGGRAADVAGIEVVQPGRNALVDFGTGEFSLSPRAEEFRK